MAYTHSPQIILDGLVLALDAANPKSYPGSGTTWNDLSGNGNNGTLVNGPTFDSDNLGSIQFDAIDDRIALSNNSDINLYFTNNTTFTLDCFVKKSSNIYVASGYNLGFCLFSNNDGGWVRGWSVYIRNSSEGNNSVIFQIGYNSQTNAVIHATEYGLIDNHWTHIAISHSIINFNSTCSFYKNGQLLNTLTSTASVLNTNTTPGFTPAIGRQPSATWQGHNSEGVLSSYKLYNRALTPQEILQNYNATKGRYGL